MPAGDDVTAPDPEPDVVTVNGSDSVSRPILFPLLMWVSVNQMLPSGPAVIQNGVLAGVMPLAYSVMTPAGVILPTLLPAISVNHRLPSGPVAIPPGWLDAVGIA